jgi:uncharacterized membrane-anchored protein
MFHYLALALLQVADTLPDTTAVVNDPGLFGGFVSTVMIAVAGFIASLLMGGLKAVSAWVDSQSPIMKQVLVLAIAAMLRVIGGLLHVNLPGSLDNITPAILSTFVSALVAYGWYAIKEALAHRGEKSPTP